MRESNEFDRDGDADVKTVVTRTGPLGVLTVLIICAAVLMIIVGLFWWLS